MLFRSVSLSALPARIDDARARELAAVACLLHADRWLGALAETAPDAGRFLEDAGSFLEEARETLEALCAAGSRDLVVLARSARGFHLFAGPDDATLRAWTEAREAEGADLLGLNPAKMTEEVRESSNRLRAELRARGEAEEARRAGRVH